MSDRPAPSIPLLEQYLTPSPSQQQHSHRSRVILVSRTAQRCPAAIIQNSWIRSMREQLFHDLLTPTVSRMV